MTNHPNRKQPYDLRVVTQKGYALGVRCSLGHGGNRRLATVGRSQSLGFQCAGCGAFYTAELVCEAQVASRENREHSLVAA